MSDVVATLRLPREVWAEIRKLAIERSVPVSVVVEEIFRNANFLFDQVMPKMEQCAKDLPAGASGKEHLHAQVECVLEKFGKKSGVSTKEPTSSATKKTQKTD